MTELRGVGVGLRREHFDAVQSTTRRLDWVEIIPENFMASGGRPWSALHACRSRFPVSAHGVAMNLGGEAPLSDGYFEALVELVARFELAGVSEHLCYSVVGGRNLADLLPLPHSEAAVEWVVPRIREAQERLGRQILLENISTYARMPNASMTEGEFVSRVVHDSGAGLLLDINNVVVNAHNHGESAMTLLQTMPLPQVAQIHLAGHRVEGGLRIDDHGSPVCDEVWSLYREALRWTGRVPVLIEWDTRIPPLDRVLDEADRARLILDEVCPCP